MIKSDAPCQVRLNKLTVQIPPDAATPPPEKSSVPKVEKIRPWFPDGQAANRQVYVSLTTGALVEATIRSVAPAFGANPAVALSEGKIQGQAPDTACGIALFFN